VRQSASPVSRIATPAIQFRQLERGTTRAGSLRVAEQTDDRHTDRIDVLVYILWAALLLLVLLRFI
jgi:hypothetical protein